MKKLVIIILLAVLAFSASAQKLVNLYKKGTIKLVPDTEYARGNDWNKVFETYYDTLYKKPMGNRKSLKIMPDGSVVVNHAYRNYYSKFSPTGTFVKEFGVINSKGKQFKKVKHIAGIVNNNAFFTGLDNMGNMVCFDFDGNYVKTLKLDYKTKQMIPLPNGKIAVVGWVLWKTKIREFVSIVDYETNDQKVIWEHFTDRCALGNHCKLFNYSYGFEKRGAISFTTMPFSRITGMSSPPKIETVGNNLIVAVPASGEMLIYDIEGNLQSKDRIEWATKYVSIEEQKEIQQKAIDRYKKIKEPKFASWVSPEENQLAMETVIKEMEADLKKIKDPIPIPTFSTIIKDSDGNLLFFEYPKEKDDNKFNVWIYENNGKFVCQSSFVCDDYNLIINPSKMVFHKGYIYGLQLLKKSDGVPLRLVRFRLTEG